MRCDTLEDMPTPQTRRRPASTWPPYLTEVTVAAFTGWGWTAQDWHEMDAWVGDLFGLKRGMLARAGRRSNYNLREWLRDSPPVITAAVGRDRFAQAVTDHGASMTPNVLDVYAAGASTRFAATFLVKDPNSAGWPQRDVISAWKITQEAHLTEPAVTGWALTGWLTLKKVPTWAPPAEEVSLIAGRITAWVDEFGPAAYLYVLAGFTMEEATAMQIAGKTPADEQLQVMAALNGHVLPPGV